MFCFQTRNECDRKCGHKNITEFLVEDLHKGCKTVSGARGIADDGFICAVIKFIDTDHVGGDVSFTRCCDEHFLSSCLNVFPSTFSVYEHPSSFNHQVYPQLPAIKPHTHLHMLLSSPHKNHFPRNMFGCKPERIFTPSLLETVKSSFLKRL